MIPALRHIWILSVLLLTAVVGGAPTINRPVGSEMAESEDAQAVGISPQLAVVALRRRPGEGAGTKLARHAALAPLIALTQLGPQAGCRVGDASPRLPNGLNAPLRN